MRIGILGGSFNPVHVGHLRLALEARELLRLDRVDLVPAAVPPHKSAQNLLPFGLRCRLLGLAVAGRPGLAINLTEGRRRGPSYTWDTLSAYARECPQGRLFFLMGVPDLQALPAWRNGLKLPQLADLVAVARQGMAQDEVRELVSDYWPGATGPERLSRDRYCAKEVLQWRLPGFGRLLLLCPPFLDVSSTLIRSYWQQGRDMQFLVPHAVIQELIRLQSVVQRFWRTAESGESAARIQGA